MRSWAPISSGSDNESMNGTPNERDRTQASAAAPLRATPASSTHRLGRTMATAPHRSWAAAVTAKRTTSWRSPVWVPAAVAWTSPAAADAAAATVTVRGGRAMPAGSGWVSATASVIPPRYAPRRKLPRRAQSS